MGLANNFGCLVLETGVCSDRVDLYSLEWVLVASGTSSYQGHKGWVQDPMEHCKFQVTIFLSSNGRE